MNDYTFSELELAARLAEAVHQQYLDGDVGAEDFNDDARRIITLIGDYAVPEPWEVTMAYSDTGVVIMVNGFCFHVAADAEDRPDMVQARPCPEIETADITELRGE